MRIRDFIAGMPGSKEFRSYLAWMRREMADDKYLMKALNDPR